MSLVTEAVHTNEFLVSEADGQRSIESVTVLSGQNLLAGTVIGLVAYALAAAPNPSVVGTGNGTMTLVRPGPEAQTGNYVVRCTAAATHGGTFSVTAPDGNPLPALTLTAGAGTATAYQNSHIAFTITDGSTDFAVNDTFTIAVTAAGTPAVVGTGNGTMSAISLGPIAQPGTYRVVCTAAGTTHGGTFQVFAPDGDQIGTVVMPDTSSGTAAFTSDHVNFTLTDGSTNFAAGAYFHIVVAKGSGKAKAWSPTAVDGSQFPYGILSEATDASSGDLKAPAVVREAVVAQALLTGFTELARSGLAARGIIVR